MLKRVGWKIIPVMVVAVSVSVMGKQVSIELEPKEELGKALFFDNISSPDRMACASCHAPETGWTGRVGGINVHGSVERGAIPTRFGNRKPPSAAYATLSPVFKYDKLEELFVGGNFWDGRATGIESGNPSEDQALGPFLNSVEQNNPSKLAVLEEVAASKYADLWKEVWGDISVETSEKIDSNYRNIGKSIAAYEASPEVNQFSSKYDAYMDGMVKFTAQEERGMELFNAEDKGNCAACHTSGKGSPFTDFTFDNLGVPKNPENPFYKMDTVYLDDGSAINPEGKAWVDIGLAGFLLTTDNNEWKKLADENKGKQKVPTLRNVDKRYGESFPKSYMHNGYFKSLKSVVHFYNTRDRDDKKKCEDPFTTEKDALKMNCWPRAEVPENVNKDELGDLGLSSEEEDDIVAFLKTLSDGYDVTKNK